MIRLELSGPAQRDIGHVLDVSAERWGAPARQRYADLLIAALASIAANPDGPTTRALEGAGFTYRSLHLRHARGATGVRAPVHVIYYRVSVGVVEILRVLHERMPAQLHIVGPR